tara:strand:+ start:42 stop:197 length:156 start_codon:yes stop_codon:yes gene_type:complete
MSKRNKSGKRSNKKEQHVWDSVLETYIDKSKKVSGYYINDGKIKILYERKV